MPVRVVIRDNAIARFHQPGGMVYRFTRKIGRNTSSLARKYVRTRTGELKRGIQDPEMDTGPNHTTATVRSLAPHTLYYHEGTRTPITRPGGGLMPIHNATRTAVIAYATSVRGQRAKPFLADALRDAFLAQMGSR